MLGMSANAMMKFLPDIYFRYVQSWIDRREVQSEKANLQILFDKYVSSCLDTLRVRFKKITPIVDISMIQMLCYLLEVLLTPENTPPDSSKELYELYFIFAAIWAFGGSMFQDQVNLILFQKACSFDMELNKLMLQSRHCSSV